MSQPQLAYDWKTDPKAAAADAFFALTEGARALALVIRDLDENSAPHEETAAVLRLVRARLAAAAERLQP